ncbi:MAG: hypothetical protein D6694_06935 [Gammaproteobacteria bacterium]|nr:MAG: hypothetical protein D6694_06935 [Gammaproteobacteria bacterium]
MVVIALALKHQLLETDASSVVITAGVLSMLLSQPVARLLEKHLMPSIVGHHTPPPAPTELVEQQAQAMENHVIICGFGRVGQIIYRLMKQAGYPVIAIDNDATRVQEAISGGESIVYGSATSRDILKVVGIERARMLAVSFNHVQDAMTIITEARALNPPIIILCRTGDDTHLDELLRAGATEVIPETLESAMMLVAHALTLSGEPLAKVLRRLQETRDNRYGLLHGFYHGAYSDPDAEFTRALQKLHAVTITENSRASGCALDTSKLS